MRNKFVLLLATSCLFLVGCQKTTPKVVEAETMTVSLNIKGDFDVAIDQDPLSKASTSSNDVYGINVYYDKEGDDLINDIYAYGLFDNVADMTITLLANHNYKVCCTLVKDAKSTLYFGSAFGNSYLGYCYPFQTTTSNSTVVNNKFILGTDAYLSGIYSGDAHIASTTSPSTSNATKNASVNRFYGQTDKYVPVHNGVIDVYLKRAVFGAKFVVTGLEEGTLNVTCGDFCNKTYYRDNEGNEAIYTLTDLRTDKLTTKANITYTSVRGTQWDLTQSLDITFKRNVMTTVNIKLNPDLSGGLFDLTEEEMDEDNDINMGINADGLIDVIVNPQN